MRNVISKRDLDISSINNQRVLISTGSEVSDVVDPSGTYFLLAVVGTSVAIKDKGGNTIVTITNQTFNFPIRIGEGGIKASASGALNVVYCVVDSAMGI